MLHSGCIAGVCEHFLGAHLRWRLPAYSTWSAPSLLWLVAEESGAMGVLYRRKVTCLSRDSASPCFLSILLERNRDHFKGHLGLEHSLSVSEHPQSAEP